MQVSCALMQQRKICEPAQHNIVWAGSYFVRFELLIKPGIVSNRGIMILS
jgi:hypothetical protein